MKVGREKMYDVRTPMYIMVEAEVKDRIIDQASKEQLSVSRFMAKAALEYMERQKNEFGSAKPIACINEIRPNKVDQILDCPLNLITSLQCLEFAIRFAQMTRSLTDVNILFDRNRKLIRTMSARKEQLKRLGPLYGYD